VEQAVRESIELGVDKKGKEVTPWLLKRVGELTQGKALESSELQSTVGYCDVEGILTFDVPVDIALIENNARVGAKLAQELLRLKTEGAGGLSSVSHSS
jgi:pseudouridine-5'-phosphate glycosidase/pseudouridine kinase